MAPIRKGDGTPLEIPGVQEVRTGDGRVFFGAIPDWYVSQYRMDEGDGSSLTNAFDGQPDATLNGPSWFSDSNLVGGFGLIFDGSDQVDLDSNLDFIGDNEQFSFAVTVNPDNLDNSEFYFTQGDSETVAAFGQIGNGGIGISWFDNGSWQVDASVSNPPTGRIRVGFRLDTENNQGDVAINGDIVTDSSNRRSGDLATGATLGARQDGVDPYNGSMDNAAWANKYLTASEFAEDYQSQPFSE